MLVLKNKERDDKNEMVQNFSNFGKSKQFQLQVIGKAPFILNESISFLLYQIRRIWY